MEFAVNLSQHLDPTVLNGWQARDWVHLEIGDVTMGQRHGTWAQCLWVDVLADEDDDTEIMAAEVTDLARLVAEAVSGDFEFLFNGDTEVCSRVNGRMRYGHRESDGWWGDRFREAMRAA
jgi:hypothetical protein